MNDSFWVKPPPILKDSQIDGEDVGATTALVYVSHYDPTLTNPVKLFLEL